MPYCDCQEWYDEEANSDTIINFKKLRKGNFCPFCGKPLLQEGE